MPTTLTGRQPMSGHKRDQHVQVVFMWPRDWLPEGGEGPECSRHAELFDGDQSHCVDCYALLLNPVMECKCVFLLYANVVRGLPAPSYFIAPRQHD